MDVINVWKGKIKKGEQMNLENIILLKNIILVLITFFIFLILTKSTLKEKADRFTGKTRLILDKGLRKTKINYFNYDRLSVFLTRSGIDFWYQNKINPINYIVYKILISVLMLLIGIKVNIYFSIPLGILGFMAPDILIKNKNENDNEEMMQDIKKIYDTVKIQTKAGVFLTDSLVECYLVVKMPRLKAALLELSSNIVAKNDIESSIDEFNQRFKNSYIDTFCIILKQSLESGKRAQILEDISTQLVNVQHAINMKEKESLDRKIGFIQLCIFAGITVIAIYAMGMEFYQSILKF